MKKYDLYRVKSENKRELVGWVELPEMEKSSLVSSIPFWCLRNYQTLTRPGLLRDELVWVGELVE
jgi:hypothetical protein